MNYNFDEIILRRGTDCYKWDCAEDDDVLPLWVADMDFKAAPCILNALEKRLQHGVFGYEKVPERYYDAVRTWFQQRHNWRFERQWMLYTTGVVPALSAILRAVVMTGDKVLLTTPVYNCFFSCVRNNGAEVAESPLLVGDDGMYHIDWDDFEQQCADDKVVAYILCNPQNPGGRVWTKDELARIGDICRRNHVLVISDEIHNELIMPGHTYTPFASVSKENEAGCVVCTSASKSFNIAGLQMANIVCADPALRRRIDRAINIHETCDVNPFGPVATIAAYSDEGAEWLDELCEYLLGNYVYLCQQLAEHLPMLHVMPLEGTYLAWVDCKALLDRLHTDSRGLEERLVREARVWFNEGSMYGRAGEGYLRINLACQRSTLVEAMRRFSDFLDRQQ